MEIASLAETTIGTFPKFDLDLLSMPFQLGDLISRRSWTNDAILSVILTFALTAARYSLQYATQNIASRYGIVKESLNKKFSESTWKLIYYTLSWIWGAYLTLPENFFWYPALMLEDWPGIAIPNPFRIFYLVQNSFYISSFICHLTIEVRRKDFMQMLIHHVVSSALIMVSYYLGLYRFGAVLLLLHDINDVILESAKLLIYSGYQKAADCAFGLLILCWFTTRIALYPMKVIYTGMFTSIPFLVDSRIFNFYIFINFLLVSLLGLNIMWFGMMIRLLLRVIMNKGKVNDTREDEEE